MHVLELLAFFGGKGDEFGKAPVGEGVAAGAGFAFGGSGAM
jgi:hypothetical protein